MENHIYMVGSDTFFWNEYLLQFNGFSKSIFCFEGFKLGSENHTTEARVEKSGALNLTSGIGGLALLKTTQVYKHLSVDICFFVRKVLNCQCYHCYILDNGELDVFHGLWTSVFQFFLVNKEAPVVFPYFVNHQISETNIIPGNLQFQRQKSTLTQELYGEEFQRRMI